MNWLEVTRPWKICSGERLLTTVTSYLFCRRPNASCNPDCPPPTMAIFLIRCSLGSEKLRPSGCQTIPENFELRQIRNVIDLSTATEPEPNPPILCCPAFQP